MAIRRVAAGLGLLAVVVAGGPSVARADEDLPVAGFDGADYGAWEVTGEAFGAGPARGTLPRQQAVTGFIGAGLVNSYHGGDGAVGTLTSPEFEVRRAYVNFLVGGGNHPGRTCVNLLVDGKVVRTATGADDERLDWVTWDVREFRGKTARVQIVDEAREGWAHINVDQIVQSDRRRVPEIDATTLYGETYRPQFHFTSRTNWLNDPNGLVYFGGEYHLFFQHNPAGNEWGNMTWGHAVSPDLVHWRQLEDALKPDALGTMFSGSAVVDWGNTAGFRTGAEPALVAMYTAAGGTSAESKGRPFTQCLAYSNDRGRTWTKYAGNPVLGEVAKGNRDPKVVWHGPTRRWVMALYKERNDFALFASPNLKAWTHLQDLTVPGCDECPDFFELPVDGNPKDRRWVFTAANGHYVVGTFDGQRFTPQGGPLVSDQGGNFYAVQTYSDVPDGRRIQVAWMRGGRYPRMPFNQQMSFPCELTLHETAEGVRLRRWPVREIEGLRREKHAVADVVVDPARVQTIELVKGDLFDLAADVVPGSASEVTLAVRGTPVTYRVADHKLVCMGRTADVPLGADGRLRLRVLVDRTSLEIFANEGDVSMSFCFLPDAGAEAIELSAKGGTASVPSLTVYGLASAWAAAH